MYTFCLSRGTNYEIGTMYANACQMGKKFLKQLYIPTHPSQLSVPPVSVMRSCGQGWQDTEAVRFW